MFLLYLESLKYISKCFSGIVSHFKKFNLYFVLEFLKTNSSCQNLKGYCSLDNIFGSTFFFLKFSC